MIAWHLIFSLFLLARISLCVAEICWKSFQVLAFMLSPNVPSNHLLSIISFDMSYFCIIRRSKATHCFPYISSHQWELTIIKIQKKRSPKLSQKTIPNKSRKTIKNNQKKTIQSNKKTIPKKKHIYRSQKNIIFLPMHCHRSLPPVALRGTPSRPIPSWIRGASSLPPTSPWIGASAIVDDGFRSGIRGEKCNIRVARSEKHLVTLY